MRVIPPLTIDGTNLTSSTVAEPHASETEYDGGDTYASGDQVISVAAHLTYESLVDGNVGNPLPVAPETVTAFWAVVGPTIKWAMFDLDRNTATTDDGPLTVVITPGQRVDALGLVGLDADSVEIMVEAGDPLAEVYSYSQDLTTREVGSWYEYFFAPFVIQPSLVLFDLPPYISAVITITLTRTSGDVACAGVVLGQAIYMGELEQGPVSDVDNFSAISRDEFGNATLVRRRNVPLADLTIWTDKGSVNRLRQLRDTLNAAPALWSGLDDAADGYFEAVLILGIYKRFAIGLDQHEQAKISLTLEEI